MASFNEVTRGVGKKRVTEKIPYTGDGVDALTAQVGAILKVEKDAQRIILDVTKPYIHLEKFAKGQADQEAEQELFDAALRSNLMREYMPGKKQPPYEYLFNLFKQVTDEGLEAVVAFVGNMASLERWIPISRRDPRLFGIPVRCLKNVPDDVILICGAEWAVAELEDIRFSVKGIMS